MARLAQSGSVDSGGDVSEEMLREQIIDRFEPTETQAGGSATEIVREQIVDDRSATELRYERFDQALNALSGGIVRIERKLDRILALIVEARGRNRQ